MKKTTLARVLTLVRPYGLQVALSLVTALLTAGIQLLIPVLCGLAIDRMPGAGHVDLAGILRILRWIGGGALLGACARGIQAWANQKLSYSVARDLRNRTGAKLHRLPLSYLDAHPSGDLLSRMVSDADTFSEGLLMGFTQLFTGVVTILGTLIIMLCYQVTITLVVVLLTPLSLFAAWFIAHRTHSSFVAQARLRGEETALLQELVEGQQVIQAFGRQEASLRDYDRTDEKLQKAAFRATFFSSLTNPSTRLINNMIYAAVCLISALLALTPGGVTIGQLSVFLSYASQYAKPFNEISGVVTELQNALTCADRIFELLDQEEEPPEGCETLVCRGRVELRDISFRYTPEKPLLEHISLRVPPGQRIAIVGPTGCGKTTLVNLLMGFYPVDRGLIAVDGRDIRTLTRRSLRGSFGMVLQNTWLRSGTVAENIAYGRPDATREEIEEAARRAHAHGFIRRLSRGYDTPLGENGGGLSLGQRQLLCIARVMLCRPPMLILDEATSSIDIRTEQLIQQAFRELMEGRTTFVVAHRLSTIRGADQILVMDHGTVVEQGTHESLLARKGFYARLYNSQFREE